LRDRFAGFKITVLQDFVWGPFALSPPGRGNRRGWKNRGRPKRLTFPEDMTFFPLRTKKEKP